MLLVYAMWFITIMWKFYYLQNLFTFVTSHLSQKGISWIFSSFQTNPLPFSVQSTTSLKEQPDFDCCFALYLVFSLAFKLPSSHKKYSFHLTPQRKAFLFENCLNSHKHLNRKGKNNIFTRNKNSSTSWGTFCESIFFTVENSSSG